MSEISISEKDLGLPKTDTRAGVLPALKDLVRSQETTIGATPEQRVAWLTGMQPTDISRFLIDLNGTARGITENRTFDGEGVQAGSVGGSIPPDQQDKEPILHYALTELQKRAHQMIEAGASYQEVLDSAAVTLPTVINKLHLFGDGNGRTSRILRMLIRDGSANADAGIDATVSKDRFNKYDTTPSAPIDRSIGRLIRGRYNIQDTIIEDDLLPDDGPILIDEYIETIKSIPNMNPRIAKSWEDTNNFKVVASDFAKRNNMGTPGEDGQVKVSLKNLLTELSDNPKKQTEFLDGYRKVRKEKVMLWTDALTGKVDLPVNNYQTWLRSINFGRDEKNQLPLNDQDVNTAVKLQTAYMESQSPIRTQQ